MADLNTIVDQLSELTVMEAAELATPYLDLFTPLSADPAWEAALLKSDGLHPNSEGYVIMAEHIGAWAGWRSLFDG